MIRPRIAGGIELAESRHGEWRWSRRMSWSTWNFRGQSRAAIPAASQAVGTGSSGA